MTAFDPLAMAEDLEVEADRIMAAARAEVRPLRAGAKALRKGKPRRSRPRSAPAAKRRVSAPLSAPDLAAALPTRPDGTRAKRRRRRPAAQAQLHVQTTGGPTARELDGREVAHTTTQGNQAGVAA